MSDTQTTFGRQLNFAVGCHALYPTIWDLSGDLKFEILEAIFYDTSHCHYWPQAGGRETALLGSKNASHRTLQSRQGVKCDKCGNIFKSKNEFKIHIVASGSVTNVEPCSGQRRDWRPKLTSCRAATRPLRYTGKYRYTGIGLKYRYRDFWK